MKKLIDIISSTLNESNDELKNSINYVNINIKDLFDDYVKNHDHNDTIQDYINWVDNILINTISKGSDGILTKSDLSNIANNWNKDTLDEFKKAGFKSTEKFDKYLEYIDKNNIHEGKTWDWMSSHGNIIWFGIRGLMLIISRIFIGLQDIDFEMMGEWDAKNNDVMRDYFNSKANMYDSDDEDDDEYDN